MNITKGYWALKQEFRVNTRKLNFAILYVFSLIHTTHIHKSIVQRKIIVISLGFFVLVTIPFLGFAFAVDIPVGGGGTVSPNLVESFNPDVIFGLDADSSSVFVIDVSTKNVIQTVPIGTDAQATEFVPSTPMLYVTNTNVGGDGIVTRTKNPKLITIIFLCTIDLWICVV